MGTDSTALAMAELEPRCARPGEADALRELVHRAYESYIARIGRRPAPTDDDYEAKVRDHRVDVVARGQRLLGVIVLIA